MKTRFLFSILAVTILMFVTGTAAARPMNDPIGTGFTYQGRLSDGGIAADGGYDFEFRLYDALTDGTQVGSAVTLDDVTVTDGLFTVELDFGAVFDGTALYLEIGVRAGDSEAEYTTLIPRQSLTATPYALHSARAPWSGITGMPAGFADDVDDVASYAAGPGLELIGSEFSVDTSMIQQRVGESCAAGNAISLINSDGSVSCQPVGSGDITAVNTDAGSGLTGGASSGDANLSVIFGGSGIADEAARSDHDHDDEYVEEDEPDSITSSMIVNGTLSFFDWASNGCAAGELPKWSGTGWACAADVDTNTTYEAGTGLTLGGGAFNVDTTVIQGRVLGTCGAGNAIRAVGADGAVTCEAIPQGDITGVSTLAGSGLTGGAASGDANLAVSFGGSGAATSAARSDHGHDATYVNEGQADSVTSPMIVNGAITFADWSLNACTEGQIAKIIGGAWVCGPDSNSGGDITAVIAGAGLSGGASSGDASLAVSFGGSGAATSAARSDHDHWGQTWSGAGTGLTLNGGTTGLYATGDTNGVSGYSATNAGVHGAGGPYGVEGTGSTYGVHGYGGPIGVRGDGTDYGVEGVSDDVGVQGTGDTYGVVGISDNIGIHGSGVAYGITGNSDGTGVVGNGTHNGVIGNGSDYGVIGNGTGASSIGVDGGGNLYGVYGHGPATGVYGNGGTIGVIGESDDPGSTGVKGSGLAYGVTGAAVGAGSIGVDGGGDLYGVYGHSGATGVNGNGGTYGVHGIGGNTGVQGNGDNYGLSGYSSGNTGAYGWGGSYGVHGDSTFGTGVKGTSTNSTGVAGTSTNSTGVEGRGPSYGLWGQSAGTGVYGNGSNYGVYGMSTSMGVYGSGGTYGVSGESTGGATGAGVYGDGGLYGVFGKGDGYGVWGESTDGSSNGVYGKGGGNGHAGVVGQSTSNSGYGVYGIANGGANQNYAGFFDGNVKVNGGVDASGASTGVYGSGSSYGLYGTGNTGVYGTGSTGVSGNGSTGVRGAGGNYGVYGTGSTGVFGAGAPGLYGQGTVGGAPAIVGNAAGGSGTNYAGLFYGNVIVYGSFAVSGGSKSAVVETEYHGTRALYAVESPENWFEDFGTGQLVDGAAVITIETIFAETVNLGEDYHVFVTPLGDCALYVDDKTPTSFAVHAMGGGSCSTAFDYRIVAKRLGFEEVRLAEQEQP